MTNWLSSRALAGATGVMVVVVLVLAVRATQSSPSERLSSSVDHAVDRTDRVERALDALAVRVPSTTAPPPTFLTTTTSTSLVALATTAPATTAPPTVALTPASRQQLDPIIKSGRWDFELPVPAQGLSGATFSPSPTGGMLSYDVPAPAADAATFFRTALGQRGFAFSEQRAGDQSTFLLGGQGQIVVGPSGVRSTALTVTISI